MLFLLAKPSLTDFLKIVHRSIFLKFVLNSIFSDIHNQIFFIIPNIDSKCFIIKSKLWFFNVHVRIFPTGGLWSPTVAKKIILFSPLVESSHHNLITHPVFSRTKESNCQNNSSSNFPPTPSKITPPSKTSNSP